MLCKFDGAKCFCDETRSREVQNPRKLISKVFQGDAVTDRRYKCPECGSIFTTQEYRVKATRRNEKATKESIGKTLSQDTESGE